MGGRPFKLSVRSHQPWDELGKGPSGTVNGQRTGPEEGPRWSLQEWKAVELGHSREDSTRGRVSHVRKGSGQDGWQTVHRPSLKALLPVRLFPLTHRAQPLYL